VVLSRSFVGFVVFCGLLIAISAVGVWYMGTTLVGIVVDADKRENPYYLLHLIGAGSAELVSDYRTAFLTLAGNDGAELQWQAGELEVAEGSPLLTFDQVQLLRFPAGGDLVQMLTGSGYRHLAGTAGAPSTLLLGSTRPPDEFPARGAVLLALLRVKPAASAEDLGSPDGDGWLGTVDENGGRRVWDAPLDTIRGDQTWNRLVAIHFPDLASAEAWLSDPATVTERAIAERAIQDSLVLVAAGLPLQSR